ncbi:MAG TPA: methyl-accepting chemotaxis protein, partial [Rhodopila sp.]|nr:methyl-accepting chemotaxis protein [Rhodopila sp.]
GLEGVVAEQATVAEDIAASLVAAQDLRVASREVELQQTSGAVKASLQRARQQHDASEALLHKASGHIDPARLNDASARLAALMDTVQRAADARVNLIVMRQKRLFQARSAFETSLSTLTAELSNGAALASGVDSVREKVTADNSSAKADDANNPQVATLTRYRIAMSQLQQAALMFMATGNGGAANEIADANTQQEAAMKELQAANLPQAVQGDVRLVQTLGKGIADASTDLVHMTRGLEEIAGTDMEKASKALQASFDSLSAAAKQQQQVAVQSARQVADEARSNLLSAIAAVAVALVAVGAAFTLLIAGPMRRLTKTVQAIAGGTTDLTVPYVGQRDEMGRMAASVETLRGVMRETFIQSQVIEQLPVGVMTAAPSGERAITYANAETRAILGLVQDELRAPPDELAGRSLEAVFPDTVAFAAIADPGNLPHHQRFTLGHETLDLRVSATMDREGNYAGPLLIWRRATDETRLVTQFEESVGRIAQTVAGAAGAMREAAVSMRASTVEAGTRTLAVSAASDQASHSVSTAASGAEEVAVSVAEIGREVAESARIAAQAVAEAEATNASVSSLSHAAEQISAIISLIRDIAGRTNLLALNATIEAARAGEAGKGFAVVASEVKNLATQTAKATEDIGSQISAMQQATSAAVSALRAIGGTIERMNEIAGRISDTVGQQGEAAQSIATAVAHAAAGTAEVNSNIAAVSGVVGETSEKAGGLLEAATAMTDQAAMLQQEVAGFLSAVQQAA